MWFQKPPLGTPLDWGNPLNDGTVMALAMNEGHGDKVQDLSLNGNHGTLHNFAYPPTAASGWNPGQTGIGLNFNGIDNYVDCGNVGNAGALFFSALVNPTSGATNYLTIIGRYLNATNYLYWRVNHGTGNLELYWQNAGASDGTFISTAPVSFDEWNHCAAAINGTDVTLYINGISVRDDVAAVNLPNAPHTYIGQRGDTNRWFIGSIDQPRIQSRAWSAKEVRDYAINPWQVYLDE